MQVVRGRGLSLVVAAALAAGTLGALPDPVAHAAPVGGQLYSWGENSDYQLGNGTTTDTSTPIPVPGMTNVTQAEGGYNGAIAVKADGSVWTWGTNWNGLLGNGFNQATSPTPERVKGLPFAIAVATRHDSAYALSKAGDVWAWGSNQNGQLGDGTHTDSGYPERVPNLSGVVQIAAGDNFLWALRSDGTVWGFGWNAVGVLGPIVNTFDFVHVTHVPGLAHVTSIGVGDETGYAVVGGHLFSLGYGQNGEMGQGAWQDRDSPVQALNLDHVTHATGAYSYGAALRSDGTVWAFGGDDVGQLGIGQVTPRNVPVEVRGLSGANALVQTGDGLLALRGGRIWGWGGNQFGQLGDGTTTTRLAPVLDPALTHVIGIGGGYWDGFAIVG